MAGLTPEESIDALWREVLRLNNEVENLKFQLNKREETDETVARNLSSVTRTAGHALLDVQAIKVETRHERALRERSNMRRRVKRPGGFDAFMDEG